MVEKEPSLNNKKDPKSLKDMEIIFAPNEEVTEFAYLLIETLFGIQECFLTDYSELSHFLSLDEFPGHERVPFDGLSDEDKKLYLWANETFSEEDRKRLVIEYPPITQEEIDLYKENERKMFYYLIEQTFGVSMSDYPENENLFVWKVANYILLKQRVFLLL